MSKLADTNSNIKPVINNSNKIVVESSPRLKSVYQSEPKAYESDKSKSEKALVLEETIEPIEQVEELHN